MIDKPDYIIETVAAIDEQIAALEKKARDAHTEAIHARGIPGLEGPARAAEVEVERLIAEIANQREIRIRIEQGFPCWERFGFENALDACGESWRWYPLAEVLTSTLALGEDAGVRIPLDAQQAYARTVESELFERFEICSAFEVEGDDVTSTTNYLFGTMGGDELQDALFLVAQW